jgi:hypothetical protein
MDQLVRGRAVCWRLRRDAGGRPARGRRRRIAGLLRILGSGSGNVRGPGSAPAGFQPRAVIPGPLASMMPRSRPPPKPPPRCSQVRLSHLTPSCFPGSPEPPSRFTRTPLPVHPDPPPGSPGPPSGSPGPLSGSPGPPLIPSPSQSPHRSHQSPETLHASLGSRERRLRVRRGRGKGASAYNGVAGKVPPRTTGSRERRLCIQGLPPAPARPGQPWRRRGRQGVHDGANVDGDARRDPVRQAGTQRHWAAPSMFA